MSTYSFINALIGLARDHRRQSNRFKKAGRTPHPSFRAEVENQLMESTYFYRREVEEFGYELERFIESALPHLTQKKKAK